MRWYIAGHPGVNVLGPGAAKLGGLFEDHKVLREGRNFFKAHLSLKMILN